MPQNVPGVYYATSDLVGLIRRLLIDFVDGLVLLLVWIMGISIFKNLGLTPDSGWWATIAMILGTTFLYLVLLKRFGRTAGYAIFGAQVVNLQGSPPSIWALWLRSIFVFIRPGNTLLDLIWLTSDPHRQALRDKVARTYVIRRGRIPAGKGHVRCVRLDMQGFQLLLPEVTRDAN